MHDLNNRIYHQEVPKPENLVFEKKKYDECDFA